MRASALQNARARRSPLALVSSTGIGKGGCRGRPKQPERSSGSRQRSLQGVQLAAGCGIRHRSDGQKGIGGSRDLSNSAKIVILEAVQ